MKIEDVRSPVRDYKKCEDCNKDLNDFDYSELSPYDYGRFCVRCKNTIRHRFLNWVLNNRRVKLNSFLHTYCLNKLHRK